MDDHVADLLLREFRDFRAEINSWKQDTGERIATLETQMYDVVGNGQPGRLDVVEKKTSRYDKLIWTASGVFLTVQTVAAAVWHWVLKK